MTGSEFSSWLGSYCRLHKLTQREVALNLGLHEDSLSRMKRLGTTRVFDMALAALAFGLMPGQQPAPPLREARHKQTRLVLARERTPGRVSMKGIGAH